jgi:hypothetical protein
MDGFGQAEGIMQRIIALLFALADLAEWAATAPCHARARMLIFLRIAEYPARSVAFTTPGRPAAAACEDDSPDAALQLAARLRMLACLLLVLVRTLPEQAEPTSSHRIANATGRPHRLAASGRWRLDTS